MGGSGSFIVGVLPISSFTYLQQDFIMSSPALNAHSGFRSWSFHKGSARSGAQRALWRIVRTTRVPCLRQTTSKRAPDRRSSCTAAATSDDRSSGRGSGRLRRGDAELEPGTLLGGGRYEVVEALGSGSNGTTYKCSDRQEGGSAVAVKVLSLRRWGRGAGGWRGRSFSPAIAALAQQWQRSMWHCHVPLRSLPSLPPRLPPLTACRSPAAAPRPAPPPPSAVPASLRDWKQLDLFEREARVLQARGWHGCCWVQQGPQQGQERVPPGGVYD